MYKHCHVYSSLAHSGQVTKIFYQYGKLDFLVTWHFLEFESLQISAPIPKKKKKDMQTRSVSGFFLTLVGSYENGINAHTF